MFFFLQEQIEGFRVVDEKAMCSLWYFSDFISKYVWR